MTELTDAEAEAMREQLAAHEAARAEELRLAENQRRAEARTALQPVADLLEPRGISDLIEELDTVSRSLPLAERSIATQASNAVTVLSALVTLKERRWADTEPVPGPATAA